MSKKLIYTFHGENHHCDEVELDSFLDSFNNHAPEFFENIRAFSSKKDRDTFATREIDRDKEVSERLSAILDRGF